MEEKPRGSSRYSISRYRRSLPPAGSAAYTSRGCFSKAEDLASLRSGVTVKWNTAMTGY